jgi:hypothetical protein
LGGDDASDAPQLFCVESDEWTTRLLRDADIHCIRAAQSMASGEIGGAQRQRLVKRNKRCLRVGAEIRDDTPGALRVAMDATDHASQLNQEQCRQYQRRASCTQSVKQRTALGMARLSGREIGHKHACIDREHIAP